MDRARPPPRRRLRRLPGRRRDRRRRVHPPDASGPNATFAPGPQGGSGGSQANATGSGNATSGAGNTTWRNQTRTGQFGGARLVFGFFGESETFPVSQEAVNLTLVIRAPDAELSGSITPPCDSGGTFGCPSESYETASGRYTYEARDPRAGDWSVTFFRDEGGAGIQRYLLEIHREVLAGR